MLSLFSPHDAPMNFQSLLFALVCTILQELYIKSKEMTEYETSPEIFGYILFPFL